MKKEKPEAGNIEAMEKELSEKKAEYEQAKNELEERKAREFEDQGEVINGIWLPPEELKRRAEVKRGIEEAANVQPREPEMPITPNPYIAFREKAELADMLLHSYLGSNMKYFIDPRHNVIYQVIYDEMMNHKRRHKLDSLIKVLKDRNMIEKAGGLDFIHDIFQGLPE